SGEEVARAAEQVLVRLVSLAAIAVVLFRILQPIAFAGPSFWNWSLNPAWQDDIKEQSQIVSGESDLPWLQQWTNRPPTFALYNILVWGLGLPLGLAALAGVALAAYQLARWRRLEHLLPLAYVVATFTYHAFTFVKFMRYFLPIYPFLALFAAYGLAWMWRVARADQMPAVLRRWRWIDRQRLLAAASVVTSVVVGGTLLYALAFSSIYSRTHTRVEATRWMLANLPEGSVLANEHWDDWLPIGDLDGRPAYGDNGMYRSVEMPNYEDDTPEKLDRLAENLAQADYVILSSNRLYDSIPRLPMRYPMTIRYYQLLFGGQLGFERIKEFSSYPSLFGIQIPDQSAEEAFSVYDHP
ncbi:MAG TPA: hypothetical protein VFT99_18460, partial [Roseiflexaceae bacterium]|nr:hypothetical protein [Roseiflexaceae bacterium]